ncbi:MAG: DUF924 family protein [Xenococcaceae cyanobacterium MO_167.B27]|nr:DUF924 family protein [Xenococcaceae cyanobacterium MO_167.B27]
MMQHKEILDFWFGKPEDSNYGKPRKFWFIKDEELDQIIKSRFREIHQQAAMGNLDHWREKPLSCLALIIVLDQFSRNMFRGLPQAFATDAQALNYAQYAIAKSFNSQLLPVQRWFIYLPFEHSEDLAYQEKSVQLFRTLTEDSESQSAINYAYKHFEVIKKFGRFPHRNKILGRENTPEEIEFLKQPGSSF